MTIEGARDSLLAIDPTGERDRIAAFIRNSLRLFKREGAVVGLSGGVDSAVAATMCAEALGRDKVIGLILPEKESNPRSAEYARKHGERMGIRYECIDITPVLEQVGTYGKRDEVLMSVYPEFRPDDKMKLSLPADLLERDALSVFWLSVVRDDEVIFRTRLSKSQLNSIVAATNTKHRVRMLHLYYCAEKHNYLVCGTTNRSELVQGFFVKHGDGGVDIEPLAHLYKTQVYQLAAALGVPAEIIHRAPCADTFSQEVSDEEFYFRMPYDRLDPLLWIWERKLTAAEAAETLGLTEDQVRRAFRDFAAKHRLAQQLLMQPPTPESDLGQEP